MDKTFLTFNDNGDLCVIAEKFNSFFEQEIPGEESLGSLMPVYKFLTYIFIYESINQKEIIGKLAYAIKDFYCNEGGSELPENYVDKPEYILTLAMIQFIEHIESVNMYNLRMGYYDKYPALAEDLMKDMGL